MKELFEKSRNEINSRISEFLRTPLSPEEKNRLKELQDKDFREREQRRPKVVNSVFSLVFDELQEKTRLVKVTDLVVAIKRKNGMILSTDELRKALKDTHRIINGCIVKIPTEVPEDRGIYVYTAGKNELFSEDDIIERISEDLLMVQKDSEGLFELFKSGKGKILDPTTQIIMETLWSPVDKEKAEIIAELCKIFLGKPDDKAEEEEQQKKYTPEKTYSEVLEDLKNTSKSYKSEKSLKAQIGLSLKKVLGRYSSKKEKDSCLKWLHDNGAIKVETTVNVGAWNGSVTIVEATPPTAISTDNNTVEVKVSEVKPGMKVVRSFGPTFNIVQVVLDTEDKIVELAKNQDMVLDEVSTNQKVQRLIKRYRELDESE